MKDRVKSAVILVAVTALCMPWAITRILYFALAGGLCAYEYSKNVEKLNARCTLWVMIVYLIVQAVLAYLHMGLFVYVVCFIFCLYLALFSGVIHKRVSGIGALYTLAGMTYPCVLFGIILVISVSDIWWQTLLTACLATWICDSAALFGGMRFGKHKLAPAVSPKKTVEGALSGLLSSILSGLVVYWILGLSTPVSLRLCLLTVYGCSISCDPFFNRRRRLGIIMRFFCRLSLRDLRRREHSFTERAFQHLRCYIKCQFSSAIGTRIHSLSPFHT